MQAMKEHLPILACLGPFVERSINVLNENDTALHDVRKEVI